jgi:hypothetical protein
MMSFISKSMKLVVVSSVLMLGGSEAWASAKQTMDQACGAAFQCDSATASCTTDTYVDGKRVLVCSGVCANGKTLKVTIQEEKAVLTPNGPKGPTAGQPK